MRLLPRDEKFFDLFTAVAKLNVEAAKVLRDLVVAAPAHDYTRRLLAAIPLPDPDLQWLERA